MQQTHNQWYVYMQQTCNQWDGYMQQTHNQWCGYMEQTDNGVHFAVLVIIILIMNISYALVSVKKMLMAQ